jgi:hypothetical protein
MSVPPGRSPGRRRFVSTVADRRKGNHRAARGGAWA